MSKSMFTPGPWEHRFDGRRHYVGVGPLKLMDRVYAGIDQTDTKSEQEANARLIAAAPDLFHALNAVVGEMRREHDAGNGHFSTAEVEAAEAALAKAMGNDAKE